MNQRDVLERVTLAARDEHVSDTRLGRLVRELLPLLADVVDDEQRRRLRRPRRDRRRRLEVLEDGLPEAQPYKLPPTVTR